MTRKVLMVCAPRKEYVSKLQITLEIFATQQNQLPSFNLRTQIAWIKANPLQFRLDPKDKSRVSERIFFDNEVLPEKNEVLRCSGRVRSIYDDVVHLNLFKLMFKLIIFIILFILIVAIQWFPFFLSMI